MERKFSTETPRHDSVSIIKTPEEKLASEKSIDTLRQNVLDKCIQVKFDHIKEESEARDCLSF